MSQPWNPNVSPKGRVLGTYGGFAGAGGFLIAMVSPWPWKLLAAIPIAATVVLAVAAWKAGRAVVLSWSEGEELSADSDSSTFQPPRDRLVRRLVRLTIYFAGAAFLAMSVIAAVDYNDSHKRPHEHATVLAASELPSSGCTNGHVLMPEFRVTWRSDDPPHGMPAVFTQDDACKRYWVGHSDIVVRRRGPGGAVHVDVSPFDTVIDELVLIAAGTLLSVPIGAVWALWRIWKKPRTTADPGTISSS